MSDIVKEFCLVKDQLPPSVALVYAEYMVEEIERLRRVVDAAREMRDATQLKAHMDAFGRLEAALRELEDR